MGLFATCSALFVGGVLRMCEMARQGMGGVREKAGNGGGRVCCRHIADCWPCCWPFSWHPTSLHSVFSGLELLK